MRDILERQQVWIYLVTVALGAATAVLFPGTENLEAAINPSLGFMLFVTFLQVPISEVGRGFRELRFMGALLASNFLGIPVLVLLLSLFAPDEPMVLLGILLVLLTPCVDYVITFAHLGKADTRLLLTATPVLLIVQMLLLPAYLALFLGDDAAALVSIGPFLEAFLLLIVVPFLLAATMQFWAARHGPGKSFTGFLGVLPVPATAVVLFIVVAATVPVLGEAYSQALSALPLYIAFAAVAPLVGWAIARAFKLQPAAARAISFSSATRNSLVVLPLALAIPGAVPVLPAVIITQTLVELIAELIYVRFIPRLPLPNSAQLP